VIDYGSNGKAIGVEMTAPSGRAFGSREPSSYGSRETPLSEHDYLPVRAA